jgi:hypothetical protein
MRDFESIRRSLLRRSGLYSNKSSFPFISGDTFRSFCKLKFDSVEDLSNLDEIYGYRGKVFVAAGISQDFFSKIEKYPTKDYSSVDLVIHNGDLIPNVETFSDWGPKFSSISSVNWLGNLDNVKALPIGLENWSYMRNGVPRDFKRTRKRAKTIDLLVSFNDHTNPAERKAARSVAMQLAGVYVAGSSTSPKEYRDLVAASKYVLSPPGNGADCHRTWEAIYLGAIPIVKSEYWPFTGMGLPVLEIPNWEDLTTIPAVYNFNRAWTPDELNRIFLKGYEIER